MWEVEDVTMMRMSYVGPFSQWMSQVFGLGHIETIRDNDRDVPRGGGLRVSRPL